MSHTLKLLSYLSLLSAILLFFVFPTPSLQAQNVQDCSMLGPGETCDDYDSSTDSGGDSSDNPASEECTSPECTCERNGGLWESGPGTCVTGGINNPPGGVNNPPGGTNPGPTSGTLTNPLKSKSIGEFLTKILEVLIEFAVPILVFFIMYAGFLFATARGDTGQIEKARTALLWSVVGGVIVLGAKVIATIIQTTITGL